MKNLKFRVWDNRPNKFNYFDLTNIAGNLPSDCIDNVQQFTGAKDRRGVEIYQGDILLFEMPEVDGSFYRVRFQVVWCDFNNGWALAQQNGKSLQHTGWKFYQADDSTVVGNVFETPNLLNESV